MHRLPAAALSAAPRVRRYVLPCAGLALALTLLNCLKPLHIDDTAYHYFASQIARDPLSPYGFEICWAERPGPANETLAPPVLPYWWAAGLTVLGDDVFLWKLWLLPFHLVLVFTLHALLRRFARGLELPLLILTVLSPALLPAVNLMLDVPALALALAALTLFLRAADRDDVRLAAAAGGVAGLAMQTKYTALVVPAVLAVYALLFRRVRCGVAAVAVALGVFAGWEAFVACRHGESHFLCSLRQQGQPVLERAGPLFRALLNLAGALAPAVAVVGLAALAAPRWAVRGATGAAMLSYALVATAPWPNAAALVWRLQGVAVVAILGAVAVRSLRPGGAAGTADRRGGRVEWFLVLWVVLELAGYFVLSPFPAARRVLGVLTAVTVLAGRVASRTCSTAERAALVRAAAVGGAAVGALFFLVDWREAWAQKEAAERASRAVAAKGAHGTTWHAGSWGFRFHAEREGMRLVVPGRSRLRRGDWVVVPDPPLAYRGFAVGRAPLVLTACLVVTDGLPLRTVGGYYGGNVPLAHHRGPRAAVRVYRVTADLVPGAAHAGHEVGLEE